MLEELLPKIQVRSIQIVEDSEGRFDCKIYLDDGQKALGAQLYGAGKMNVLFGRYGGIAGVHGWGISSLALGIEDDTCSVYLYFDLEFQRSYAENLVQSDIVARSLTLWRNFVSMHTALLNEASSLEISPAADPLEQRLLKS